MSTVFPISNDDSKESDTRLAAPNKVLRDTYYKVIEAIKHNEKLILITGSSSTEKAALLNTVCKNIYSDNRIVSLTGKDIPEYDDDHHELNAIPDFILESRVLNNKLVVLLEDAHLFPTQFLSKLITPNKKYENNSQLLQIILTGPFDFKDQLLTICRVNDDELVHCTMKTLTENEVQLFAKNKTYKISSNIKNLKFKSNSYEKLSELVQSNKELLDVILEWCAALAKKDQLTEINPETITRASEFAHQFAKDKNVSLLNAYPPSHEVYKYINDLQSFKTLNHENEMIRFETEKKLTSTYLETTHTDAVVPSLELHQSDDNKQIQSPTNETINNNNDSPLQPEWTPSSNRKREPTEKSLSTLVGVISILVISFITFIAYRITINSKPETVKVDQVADNLSDKAIMVNQPIQEKIIDTNVKKPFVAPLVLGEITDPDLNAALAKQESENFKNNPDIQHLLTLAEQQLNNKQLTTPTGDNALETYQIILADEPNNILALEGVENVHEKYMSWADHYYKRNDLDKAERFYGKALQIKPENNAAAIALNAIQNQNNIDVSNSIGNKNNGVEEGAITASEIQSLLNKADEGMSQIERDVVRNEQNYKLFQETQAAYLSVLRLNPQNQHAAQRLSTLSNHYAEWAEQQTKNNNYNIALFLYGQALNLQPENTQLAQRIKQVQKLKESF